MTILHSSAVACGRCSEINWTRLHRSLINVFPLFILWRDYAMPKVETLIMSWYSKDFYLKVEIKDCSTFIACPFFNSTYYRYINGYPSYYNKKYKSVKLRYSYVSIWPKIWCWKIFTGSWNSWWKLTYRVIYNLPLPS